MNTAAAGADAPYPPLTCVVEVDTPWTPTYLSLCLDRLAYASSQELQVVRIELRRDAPRPSTMVTSFMDHPLPALVFAQP